LFIQFYDFCRILIGMMLNVRIVLYFIIFSKTELLPLADKPGG